MRSTRCFLALGALALPLLAGCPDDSVVTGDAGQQADAGPVSTDDGGPVSTDDAGPTGPACATIVPICQDESITMLDYFDTVTPALITEEGTEAGEFTSVIDATGGGLNPTQAYVYARFTDSGLEKVAISDEDALASSDWDIAFRRFIIRLNSGVSGPSCVQAARTAAGTDFDTLTEPDSAWTYRTEAYFTEPSCDLVPDGSGLGSPATALSSYWTYPGCVSMTGNVYVVRRADGRLVKLQVLGYYPLANQRACDETGAVPTPSGGGQMRVRWAFLD